MAGVVTPVKPLPDGFKLGFIGAGKMAENIARGVAKCGVLPPASILTAPFEPERGDVFRSFGVEIVKTNPQVVSGSKMIILSVKPQIVKEVLSEIKPCLSKDQILVSIAAGIKLKNLQEWSGHGRVIRVMPNTPSAVGEAASVICYGEQATESDGELVSTIFGSIGKTWTAEEKCFDAITGLSGSGPAYVYLAIEAMADGGVAAGLPRELALNLASQTVLGAAAMVCCSGKHPAQLKDDVASPAGTTIAGIRELERGGFRSALIEAVVAAANRSREFS